MKSAREIMLNPPFFIAGPCSIESPTKLLRQAAVLLGIFAALDLQDRFIFKASVDKANRSSVDSWRGLGVDKGVQSLTEVRDKVGIPVITDFHDVSQVDEFSHFVDAVQVPAALCRQTDLILAAAQTGKPVLLKKGRFMKPNEVRGMVMKALAATAGFDGIDRAKGPFAVCERGVCFGYNGVVDMSGFPVMFDLMAGCGPLVFDCTHSAPSRDFATVLARAAVATGYIDGLFAEVHPDPDAAPCDGEKMIPYDWLPKILPAIMKLWRLTESEVPR